MWRRHARDNYRLPNDSSDAPVWEGVTSGPKIGKFPKPVNKWLATIFNSLMKSWPRSDPATHKEVLDRHQLALITPYAFYQLIKPKIDERSRLEANARAERRKEVFTLPIVVPQTLNLLRKN